MVLKSVTLSTGYPIPLMIFKMADSTVILFKAPFEASRARNINSKINFSKTSKVLMVKS